VDKKLWRTRNYSKMVNVTDEALVMQVVTYYFPRWTLGIETLEEDGETVVSGVGKRGGGAVKGERNTGAKTVQIFSEYVAKFKKTRQSKFAELWDKKLQDAALKQHVLELLEKEKEMERENESESAVEKNSFDVDLVEGCFDGVMEDDEMATVITSEEI
jgi:hypothetical protein